MDTDRRPGGRELDICQRASDAGMDDKGTGMKEAAQRSLELPAGLQLGHQQDLERYGRIRLRWVEAKLHQRRHVSILMKDSVIHAGNDST